MIDLTKDYSVTLPGNVWNDIVARLRKFPMDEVEAVVQAIRLQVTSPPQEKVSDSNG